MTTDTAAIRPPCDCIEDNAPCHHGPRYAVSADTAPLSAEGIAARRASALRLMADGVALLEGESFRVLNARACADALDALSARVVDLEGENKRLKIECVSWKSLYERFAGHLRRAYNVAVQAGGSPRHGEFDTAEAITDVVGSRDDWKARATQAEAERDALREYVASTEYWKLDPHDAKERAAYLEHRLRAALSPAQPAQDQPPLVFGYTNWRGEHGTRRAIPIRVYHGATGYHPERQWLMEAHDFDKGAVRVFAMKDMGPAQGADIARELAELIAIPHTEPGWMTKRNAALAKARSSDILTTETEGSNG